jgi:hypothetical protein
MAMEKKDVKLTLRLTTDWLGFFNLGLFWFGILWGFPSCLATLFSQPALEIPTYASLRPPRAGEREMNDDVFDPTGNTRSMDDG